MALFCFFGNGGVLCKDDVSEEWPGSGQTQTLTRTPVDELRCPGFYANNTCGSTAPSPDFNGTCYCGRAVFLTFSQSKVQTALGVLIGKF